MRIEESRIHRVFMNEEEFELFHALTEQIGYGYVYMPNDEDDECYMITLYDDMLEDCYDLLKEAMDYAYYEECNRAKSDRIRNLVDAIYYESNW